MSKVLIVFTMVASLTTGAAQGANRFLQDNTMIGNGTDVIDTQTKNNEADVNGGLSPALRPYPDAGGTDPTTGGSGRHELYKFDISYIPTGSTITSATMGVYFYTGTGSPAITGYRVSRFRTASVWVEGTKDGTTATAGEPSHTWRLFNTNAWGTPGAHNTSTDIDDSTTITFDKAATTEGFSTINLNANSLVTNWVSGTNPNNGVILWGGTQASGTTYWNVVMSEFPNCPTYPCVPNLATSTHLNLGGTIRPYLDVTYTPPVDATGPAFGAAISSSLVCSTTPTLTVSVQDTGVGLEPSTVQFRYSTNGGASYSDWQGNKVLHTKGTPGVFWYPDISHPSYVIQTNDRLVYDIYTKNATGASGGVDLEFSDGSNLRDSGSIVDQNGIGPHPHNNISAQALNQWYHREFLLTSRVGRTLNDLEMPHDGGPTPSEFYIRNVQIINSASVLDPNPTLKLDVFSNGRNFSLVQDTLGIGNNAYTGRLLGTDANPDTSKPVSCTGANRTTASQTISATTGALANNSSNNRIQFRITDLNGNTTTSSAYTVYVNANPSTATNNGPICAGSTLNLFATTVSGATYAWTGPNGFASALQNPSIGSATTAASGTYNLTVTVSGCTSPATMTVATVNANPTCSIGGPDPVCPSSTGNTYTAPAAMDVYLWSVTGNGTINGANNGSSVSVDAGASGSYTVNLTITKTGCSSNCSKLVAISDTTLPVISNCGVNQQLPAGINCQTAVPDMTGDVAATDNCPGSLTITQSPLAGTLVGQGPHNIIITVKDASNNQATCNKTFTVTTPDTDGDGIIDCLDGCPNDPNKTAPGICGCGVSDADTDGDGTVDCNDGCPNDPDKIAPESCGCGVSEDDTDGDGIVNCLDGCPIDPEKIAPGICGCGVSDADTDGDGTADCNDGCPNDPNKIAPGACGCGIADTDTDEDGTPDCNDGCPNDPDKIAPGQCGCGNLETDTDEDGTADCVDGCDNDPDKIAPGQCGCGNLETDTDNDSTADCNDNCPNDPDKINPGVCGCGVADTDSDNDNIPDCIDNCDNNIDTDEDGTSDCDDGCPTDADKIAPGQCGCGNPDTDTDEDGSADCVDGCDNDPDKTAPGQCGCGNLETDTDEDGTADCVDGCDNDPDKIAPGQCGCGNLETDTDGDGTADCNDNCPNDPDKINPGVCGCGVADTDSDNDNIPDCIDNCDNNIDTDEDGTSDCDDGCPTDADKIAPGQCGCGNPDTDTDGDGSADCVDGCDNDPDKIAPGQCGCGNPDTDTDGDGTADCNDNCPNDPNKIAPGVCGCGVADTDGDSDTVSDCIDNCPTIANTNQNNSDGDATGDACDDCAASPCQNGGFCTDQPFGPVCTCLVGYSGQFCQNGPPPTVSITEWRSVRTHTGLGELGIVLNPAFSGNSTTTGPTSETRGISTTVGPLSSGIQKVQVDFNGPITLANAANIVVTKRVTTLAPNTMGPPINVVPSSVSLADSDTLNILFTPGDIPTLTCINITIGAGTLVETVTGDNDCNARSLLTDGTTTGVIGITDLAQTKSLVTANAPAVNNPKFDFNLSGGNINITDQAFVKSQVVLVPQRVVLCP